jgi:hypothetical protein
MPLIQTKNGFVPLISVWDNTNMKIGETEAKNFDEDYLFVKIGPLNFYKSENFEPVGSPIIVIEPLCIKYPVKEFYKNKDNQSSTLRRISLFFTGLWNILCSNNILIECTSKVEDENIQMIKSFRNSIDRIMWEFIPSEDFIEDLEKELIQLPRKLMKDKFLYRSLMWWGHFFNAKTSIQKFLDSYRIIELLAKKDFELMKKEINSFLLSEPKWSLYINNDKLSINFGSKNKVERFLINKYKVSKNDWEKINGFRNSIVHGDAPDIEYREGFDETVNLLRDLSFNVLLQEIEKLVITDILVARNTKYITLIDEKNYFMGEIENVEEKYNIAHEFRLESIPENEFEIIISKFESEKHSLNMYYKYRSTDTLLKNAPTTIIENKKEKRKITSQYHESSGSLTMEGKNSSS